jgi:nitroreductase
MNSELNKTIIDALTWRRAVKVFDTTKYVSDEDFHTILDAGRLSASCFGIEPWKFIEVVDPALRAQIREAAYGQAQVTDAARFVVIARRTDTDAIATDLVARTAKAQGKSPAELDGLLQAATGTITSKPEGAVRDGWLSAQTYIPLGTMMTVASMMGIDNAGMEGFDRAKVDEILGLAGKNLTSLTFFVLGYRGDDAWSKRPKVRHTFEEVVMKM